MTAGFNSHKKCARCRDKGIGDDFVKFESFTDVQRAMFSTPQYQIHREASSEVNKPEDFAASHHSPSAFVSRQDLNVLSNQLEEKFSQFEALLSRPNIFSTPKLPVSVTDPPVSDKPFINPSDPRAIGPVSPPGQDRDQSLEKSTKKG